MSSPTSNGSRKRLKTADDINETAETAPLAKGIKNADHDTAGISASSQPPSHPQLPATILGAALDYLRYAEVRTSLLAGKTIANEVVKHVQTLNICNPSEMHVLAAKRFGNATEVNILCLVKDDEDDVERCVLSQITARRAVPFLQGFPRLTKAYIGGLSPMKSTSATLEYRLRYEYYPSLCTGPDNHLALYRGLLESLCGAFEAKALSQRLDLKGIICGFKICNPDDDDDIRNRSCVLCNDICRSFPPRYVLDFWSKESCNMCCSKRERLKILRDRPGGGDIFRAETEVLEDCLFRFSWRYVNKFSEEGASFISRMKQKEALYPISVAYETPRMIKMFRELIKYGCDPTKLSRERIKHKLYRIYKGKSEVLAKSSFDRLVAMGFAVEESDFIVVDDSTETALRGLNFTEYVS